MSAFVVGDNTMQRVVSAMRRDYESCEDLDKLGRELFALNEQAVAYRYRDSHTFHTCDNLREDWTWKVTNPLTNGHVVPIDRGLACQWLKAMQCLLYQCSEGEQFQNTPLYKRLKDRIETFQSAIVSSLPEYESADWDS